VAAGELDLAICTERPSDPAVDREMIFRSPWVLWCAPTHPIAAKTVLHWKDLQGLALVEAGPDHEATIAEMRSFGPEHHPNVQIVDNVTTALGMAAEGLAATAAPAYVGVMARPLGLTLRRIIEPEIVRQVCLYRPARRSIPPAAEAFREFAVQWIRKWNLEAGNALPLGDAGGLPSESLA
jgi:DNA-binding transcriptional LysR family regulator